jgi:stage III sporulation protein AG
LKLSEVFAKNTKSGKAFAAGFSILGMTIIILSMFFEKNDGNNKKSSFTDELSAYSVMLEENLKDAVAGVVGGDVKVMITFESTFENVYYSDAVVNEAITADKTDRKSEKQLVLTGNMGDKENPVVVKMLSPKPTGAIIVCDGGNRADIKECVTELAACALNISKNKIYVTGGN